KRRSPLDLERRDDPAGQPEAVPGARPEDAAAPSASGWIGTRGACNAPIVASRLGRPGPLPKQANRRRPRGQGVRGANGDSACGRPQPRQLEVVPNAWREDAAAPPGPGWTGAPSW